METTHHLSKCPIRIPQARSCHLHLPFQRFTWNNLHADRDIIRRISLIHKVRWDPTYVMCNLERFQCIEGDHPRADSARKVLCVKCPEGESFRDLYISRCLHTCLAYGHAHQRPNDIERNCKGKKNERTTPVIQQYNSKYMFLRFFHWHAFKVLCRDTNKKREFELEIKFVCGCKREPCCSSKRP
jgi:hypothetical protein